MNTEKRVNIRIIQDVKDELGTAILQKDIVTRATVTFADMLVKDGQAVYTTKSKLRSFLNRYGKIVRNKLYIKRFDMKSKDNKDVQVNKRVYVAIQEPTKKGGDGRTHPQLFVKRYNA